MAVADLRNARRPMRSRAQDEASDPNGLPHPVAAATAPGGRSPLPGQLFNKAVHLPAPLTVYAESQTTNNRPRPVAQLNGPVAPPGNELAHPARLRRLACRLRPHGASSSLHGDYAPSHSCIQVLYEFAPLSCRDRSTGAPLRAPPRPPWYGTRSCQRPLGGVVTLAGELGGGLALLTEHPHSLATNTVLTALEEGSASIQRLHDLENVNSEKRGHRRRINR